MLGQTRSAAWENEMLLPCEYPNTFQFLLNKKKPMCCSVR